MMAGDGETGAARAARAEERALEFAEKQGGHEARIAALERERAETNAALREIRDILRLRDPHPPSSALENAALALLSTVQPKKSSDAHPLMIVLAIVGAAAIAWIARGAFPGA